MKRIRPTRLDLELAELERTNPAVRAAAENLERVKHEIINEAKQRRDPRYPCRRCGPKRCPGFGYDLGDHPGICYCNHDDGEHGPRRSVLRRWLREEHRRSLPVFVRAEVPASTWTWRGPAMLTERIPYWVQAGRAICVDCGAEMIWPINQIEPWPCGRCVDDDFGPED